MGYLFSLSKSAASTGLDVSEWMLLIFGAVLVLGIFGEYRKLPNRLLLWPAIVFEILVMIGVAGELLGDGGVFIFSRHLQTIEDMELSALGSNAEQLEARLKTVGDKAAQAESTAGAASAKSTEAATTSSRAAGESRTATMSATSALGFAHGARQEADSFEKDIVLAKTQAADAESHLAEALKQAADATAELNRIKAPRSITNRAELIKALKSFSGTEFAFGSVFGDEESFQFLKQLGQVFEEAGWRRIKESQINIGIPAITITDENDLVDLGTNTGVRVEVEAAETLESLLALPVDKLPGHIRLATTLNGILFAHIIPSETFMPDARVNVVSGSSRVIRIKVGKKP